MDTHTSNELPTDYQKFIALSRYARWLPEHKRRETWSETVARYFNFMETHLKETCNYNLTKDLRNELESAVLNLEVMPSMRALMTAGEALRRDPVAGYNCAFLAIDSPKSFDEAIFLLACGCGVGFSVERQYVTQLPVIAEEFCDSDTTIIVADSKVGWAKGLKELIGLLYAGQVPKWDLSKVRPAGSPLKTFGGRASGPGPLEDLFIFCINVFRNAAGRKLQSIECHDIMCKIAETIVVGGVRRSALISLSNLSDDRMRAAKSGQWWESNVQRALANNSAAYTEKPDMGIFMKEWMSLYDSKSGERGIFNLEGAKKHANKNERRKGDLIAGVNPCSEILLRNRGLCNLTEVVAKANDTVDTLKEKVRLATILGTFQATLTEFRYLSKDWQKNCEDERLCGVSITGIMDNDELNGRHLYPNGHMPLDLVLKTLKEVAIETNKKLADKLGINQAAAITCTKPSGTVSQLVDSSSGIHPRFSEYYIRTIRADAKDPLAKMMKDMGFPCEPDVTKPATTLVFSFPMKSPKNSVFRNDLTAIEQLDLWLKYKQNWAEHTVSITVYVRDNEWMEVGAWVYKHFNDITGISFLPYSDHIYKQAPYQECTKEEYEAALNKMPKNVDWNRLCEYESVDTTKGTQTLACSGNVCELADLNI